MKWIITSVLLHIALLSYSQKKVIISYENVNNTIAPNTRFYDLYVDTPLQKCLFLNKANLDTMQAKLVKRADGKFIGSYPITALNRNYTDFSKGKLMSVENLRGKAYLVEENIPEINWSITSQKRIINGIEVQKAVADFRGRKYIAWFSEKHPIKAGPWKLHGLPGLIFEAYDESKTYNWILRSISKENFSDEVFNIYDKKLIPVSIKEYVNIFDEGASKIASKLPKEAGNSKTTISRGREIKFEWEEH